MDGIGPIIAAAVAFVGTHFLPSHPLRAPIVARVGAHMQDRKKQVLQPETWPAWERRTSYWPFVAVAQGRATLGGFGMHALAGGAVVWLAATWAHLPLAGWAAGI